MEQLKVTNPDKIVTDPVLLSALAKLGIDKDYVEFFQDYAPRSLGKEHSPYSKFYRDLNSGKRFMVTSGLPMVDADGVKIECGWRVAGINYFTEKNNLFWVGVLSKEIKLVVKNDQPDGRKANDKLSYKPQLFLDGIEQLCGQPSLLPVDPVNSNYLKNTLEWGYGICKRRLRIIEGSLLGSWVFAQKPKGEVRIKYNQTGDFRLRLGQFKINDDEEVVKPEDFDRLAEFKGQGYPVTISDSQTFYPDISHGNTTVDGYAGREGVAETWAQIIAGAGTGGYDSDNYVTPFYATGNASAGKWTYLYRGIALFDTSGLPDSAAISAATISLYGSSKTDNLSIAPTTNVYASAPASNNAIAAADYSQVGSTPFCDTVITYANWLISSTSPYWNNFALNAAGIAAISLTGISKFGFRNANYDVTGTSPTWSYATTWNDGFSSDKGAGYKPKLVVTYTVTVDITITLTAVMSATSADTTPVGQVQADVASAMSATSASVTPVGQVQANVVSVMSATSAFASPVGQVQADVASVMASTSAVVAPTGMVQADIPSVMTAVSALTSPIGIVTAVVASVMSAISAFVTPILNLSSITRHGGKEPLGIDYIPPPTEHIVFTNLDEEIKFKDL